MYKPGPSGIRLCGPKTRRTWTEGAAGPIHIRSTHHHPRCTAHLTSRTRCTTTDQTHTHPTSFGRRALAPALSSRLRAAANHSRSQVLVGAALCSAWGAGREEEEEQQ